MVAASVCRCASLARAKRGSQRGKDKGCELGQSCQSNKEAKVA